MFYKFGHFLASNNFEISVKLIEKSQSLNSSVALQHRPAPQLSVQQLAHQLRRRHRLRQLLGELVAAPF